MSKKEATQVNELVDQVGRDPCIAGEFGFPGSTQQIVGQLKIECRPEVIDEQHLHIVPVDEVPAEGEEEALCKIPHFEDIRPGDKTEVCGKVVVHEGPVVNKDPVVLVVGGHGLGRKIPSLVIGIDRFMHVITPRPGVVRRGEFLSCYLVEFLKIPYLLSSNVLLL